VRQVLHLVRASAGPEAVADRDWVVYLDRLELDPRGAPPLPPGPLDHDALLTLTFAADLVITW
jgi:hypothetical protein